MTYEEAKSRQLDCFREGVYLRLICLGDNDWILEDCGRDEAQRDMLNACVAVVKRMPRRFRLIPGGKNDS